MGPDSDAWPCFFCLLIFPRVCVFPCIIIKTISKEYKCKCKKGTHTHLLAQLQQKMNTNEMSNYPKKKRRQKSYEYIWPLYITIKRRHSKTTWIYRVSIENGFFPPRRHSLLAVVVVVLSIYMHSYVCFFILLLFGWVGSFFNIQSQSHSNNNERYSLFLLFPASKYPTFFGHNHVCMKKAFYIFIIIGSIFLGYKLKMQIAARVFLLRSLGSFLQYFGVCFLFKRNVDISTFLTRFFCIRILIRQRRTQRPT